jgi:adenosine kinase
MAWTLDDSPSRGRILVAGSLAFDQIMDFHGDFKDHILPDKMHTINLSFLVGELKKQRGGCAANISYSLALLDQPTKIVATAGRDFDGYRQWLVEQGIDVSGIRIYEEHSTACAFITTDRADNQITGFHPGAMARAKELSLKEAWNAKDLLAIVAPDDPEAMVRHCREAKEADIPLYFDPSFQVIAMDGDVLAEAADGARSVFLNDYEFAVFQEKTGRDEKALLDLAETWVVTLGEKGSEIHRRGREKVAIPAAPVNQVLDPTGAGDAYRAGFLAGVARGLDLAVCGRMGSVSASYAVEAYGTSNHRYTRAEYERRYDEAFG